MNSNHYYMILEVNGNKKENKKLTPTNKQKPRKKAKEKEDKIKINLQIADQSCNDWKFQIYWNKLQWVNPRSSIEGKSPFYVSSKKFCLKDNNKTELR